MNMIPAFKRELIRFNQRVFNQIFQVDSTIKALCLRIKPEQIPKRCLKLPNHIIEILKLKQ
ncbi:MAG: hypothetical protein CSA01_00070 [Bacteroidetes bacterium]|nr:MAG: hypothetical protein CSA01_00070 [Bacteroidota bacterium]